MKVLVKKLNMGGVELLVTETKAPFSLIIKEETAEQLAKDIFDKLGKND